MKKLDSIAYYILKPVFRFFTKTKLRINIGLGLSAMILGLGLILTINLFMLFFGILSTLAN